MASPFDFLLNEPLLVGGALGAVALVVLIVIVRNLVKGRSGPEEKLVDLTIDVNGLPSDGPPSTGLHVQFYNVPARLSVVVMAPAGRTGYLRPTSEWGNLLDRLLPGLEEVVEQHRPFMAPWPPQLSTHGFVQSFFNNVSLPGDRGRGTVWCSLAGRIAIGNETFLLGIVCCADRPNGFSQVVAKHVGDWLHVLSIDSYR